MTWHLVIGGGGEWEENPKSNSIWVAGSESKALSKAQR